MDHGRALIWTVEGAEGPLACSGNETAARWAATAFATATGAAVLLVEEEVFGGWRNWKPVAPDDGNLLGLRQAMGAASVAVLAAGERVLGTRSAAEARRALEAVADRGWEGAA